MARQQHPKCKRCGAPVQYYGSHGGRGGYSVKCKDCNVLHAVWQRANRATRKG